MPTLLDDSDRREIRRRLNTLGASRQAQWGSLDAPRMLCHIADQMRVALGDIPTRDRSTWLTRTLLSWLVVDTGMKPPPGRARTAPEMLTTSPSTWDADLAACESLIERMGKGSAQAIHPSFGALSTAGWGRLSWKHLDHHLRQFGA